MTQQEIARLFDELSVVADSVNADSDTVTQLICEFEERLNELRLGIEAWVKVSESVTMFTWQDDDGDRSLPGEKSEELQLGFAQSYLTGVGWRLFVRRATFQKIGSGDWEAIKSEDSVPLLEASRVDRINALERFPALLSELKTKAEGLLSKVGVAKAVVI